MGGKGGIYLILVDNRRLLKEPSLIAINFFSVADGTILSQVNLNVVFLCHVTAVLHGTIFVICMALIQLITTFIHLKSLHTNLKR